jgi:hypothetical protein
VHVRDEPMLYDMIMHNDVQVLPLRLPDPRPDSRSRDARASQFLIPFAVKPRPVLCDPVPLDQRSSILDSR